MNKNMNKNHSKIIGASSKEQGTDNTNDIYAISEDSSEPTHLSKLVRALSCLCALGRPLVKSVYQNINFRHIVDTF